MATQFSTSDANGVTFIIQPGAPFQTFWEDDGDGRRPSVVSHPWTSLDAWSAEDLARWCITASELPDPPPPRPDLPKSAVTERLIALGKVGAVMSVLRSDDGLYALWFAPDWQTVYKDDERVLPILQAAGLTADEIATVMA